MTAGLAKSRSFTSIPWVRDLFLAAVNIDPSLGTFNVRVVPDDLTELARLKKLPGIDLPAGQPGFCSARCFNVVIGGRVKGAALFPDVSHYPEWQLEMVAGCHVRDTLGLQEGDAVTIEVLL